MGTETKIAWCDHTFNPWIGCTKVSPGCDHCYAETLNHRWGNDNWGKGKPRRLTADANWKQPLKWDKDAYRLGRQDKVFCASLADVMDDEAPEGGRERLWELIEKTPNLIWQLLTKRPQRYMRHVPRLGFTHKNVWLGTSAENQELYNLRWPFLRLAAEDVGVTSFISYEPALGALSMKAWASRYLPTPPPPQADMFPTPPKPRVKLFPDWVICGGESGNDRRPMEQLWAENLKTECDETGTKFFMKQMSARTPEEGAKLIPANLLVRQFPKEATIGKG